MCHIVGKVELGHPFPEQVLGRIARGFEKLFVDMRDAGVGIRAQHHGMGVERPHFLVQLHGGALQDLCGAVRQDHGREYRDGAHGSGAGNPG